jgi:hypothetical protein
VATRAENHSTFFEPEGHASRAPIKELKHDCDFVVDRAASETLLVTVGHEVDDVLPFHFIHETFLVGSPQKSAKRVTIRGVGAFFSACLDERQVIIDGVAH